MKNKYTFFFILILFIAIIAVLSFFLYTNFNNDKSEENNSTEREESNIENEIENENNNVVKEEINEVEEPVAEDRFVDEATGFSIKKLDGWEYKKKEGTVLFDNSGSTIRVVNKDHELSIILLKNNNYKIGCSGLLLKNELKKMQKINIDNRDFHLRENPQDNQDSKTSYELTVIDTTYQDMDLDGSYECSFVHNDYYYKATLTYTQLDNALFQQMIEIIKSIQWAYK